MIAKFPSTLVNLNKCGSHLIFFLLFLLWSSCSTFASFPRRLERWFSTVVRCFAYVNYAKKGGGEEIFYQNKIVILLKLVTSSSSKLTRRLYTTRFEGLKFTSLTRKEEQYVIVLNCRRKNGNKLRPSAINSEACRIIEKLGWDFLLDPTFFPPSRSKGRVI